MQLLSIKAFCKMTNRKTLLEIRKPIPRLTSIYLGISIWVIFFGAWQLASSLGWVNALLVPGPLDVIEALRELIFERGFVSDILDSIWRVVVSFFLATAVAVPLGILMGSFHALESFFNPFVSAWRYLPAPSFIPVLLMWFGTGETPKLALLFIGVVFFLITMVMDYTKKIRVELLETAETLGANRNQLVRTVIIPAVLPDIFIAMRQMLAVTWTYLVIAEIVASTTGIGAMMMRARRFLHTDEIMAGIMIIGALGLLFDLFFRYLHRKLFAYLY
jgi:NitT/TauT family transport system permease protein